MTNSQGRSCDIAMQGASSAQAETCACARLLLLAVIAQVASSAADSATAAAVAALLFKLFDTMLYLPPACLHIPLPCPTSHYTAAAAVACIATTYGQPSR